MLAKSPDGCMTVPRGIGIRLGERFKYTPNIQGYMTQPVREVGPERSSPTQIEATEWPDDLVLSETGDPSAWIMCPKEDTLEITR